MDYIQALAIGGFPLAIRCSGCAFDLGLPIITACARELNEAFTSLSDRFHDVVLVNAELLGSDAEGIINQINRLSPSSQIIVFDADESDDRAVHLIKLGAADCLTVQESNISSLRRNIFKVLERTQGGTWLSGQISETLLTSTFEGTVVFDNHLRVLLWNPAMERIFEVERSFATGKDFEEALPFLCELDEKVAIEKALEGKRVVTRDQYFYNPQTGKNGFFTAFYSPMYNRRGEIVGVVGIIKDVTKCKLNERTSFEIARRMVALTNSSSNMQWISDAGDNRIFFNRRWLEFVGNDLDDERGCGWRRHVHAEDLKGYRELTETAFEGRVPWHIECRLKGVDGRYTRFFESAYPLFLADQTFIGYVGYCTDVNGSRATDTKIPVVNVTMQTFNSLEMSPIGIVNLDTSMIVSNANKSACDLFGFPVNELVGRKISQVLGAFDMTTLQVVLSRGERIQLSNHRVIIENEKGESVRYWDISCWPQKDAGNNTTGICMSFIEATERYTSVQQKEEFVAALVHDLKTPLIGAERTLDMMLKGALGPVESGQEHMLSVLQNSNRSLLTMVQSMIDMHKCENEFLNLSLQPMKISALARECAEELRVLFNSQGIKLKHLHDHKMEGVHVMGDRMALRRVILNLLDNALKFTPYSGTVTISVRCEGDKIHLDIADTGIGIAEEECEKIFTKSFQGAVGRQMGGSAGIGLFVCRKIIRIHSGDITVARNAQGGSTFTIELPRQLRDRTLVQETVQSAVAERSPD
jgi:PAS domain S-box-containing protein